MTPQKSKLNGIFRPADFIAAERLERLYMHRLDPNNCALDEREQKHYDRLRYAMMMKIGDKKATSANLIWRLQQDLGIKRETARKLLEQLPIVYNDVLDGAKSMEKEDAVAKLHKVIERCEDRDTTYDDEVIMKTTLAISKIRGWEKEETGLKAGDLVLPQPMWSDDPSVLEDRGTDDAESIEYEEMDEDNPEGAIDKEGEDDN